MLYKTSSIHNHQFALTTKVVHGWLVLPLDQHVHQSEVFKQTYLTTVDPIWSNNAEYRQSQVRERFRVPEFKIISRVYKPSQKANLWMRSPDNITIKLNILARVEKGKP